MTLRFTPEPFSADGEPPVRGSLHRADGDDALLLAHGAGSDHRAPTLVALAEAFAAHGVTVLRCDLPFRQARPKGPPAPAGAARDRLGIATALDALTPHARRRRFVGGHSYGGRQASMLLAESPARADGLLLLSYPLHPPGRPERPRIAHLPQIRVPTLFVHGERDPFGTIAEIDAARASIAAATALVTVAGVAHALPADSARMAAIVDAFMTLVGP